VFSTPMDFPNREASSSLTPATATISTLPRRRMASEWTFPMKPAPMTAVFTLCISVRAVPFLAILSGLPDSLYHLRALVRAAGVGTDGSACASQNEEVLLATMSLLPRMVVRVKLRGFPEAPRQFGQLAAYLLTPVA